MADAALRKRELRERAIAARAALGAPARSAASATIREHLEVLPAVTDASCVLAYAAFGHEVQLDPLLARLLAGARHAVVLPYVVGDTLESAAVEDLGDLGPGYRGVREPPPPRRPADPRQIDTALVPGLAFDRRGGRLGYGGGHFDRLLARLRPDSTVIGVAYAAQVLDEVPVQRHDRRVDMVMTEEGNLRVPR